MLQTGYESCHHRLTVKILYLLNRCFEGSLSALVVECMLWLCRMGSEGTAIVRIGDRIGDIRCGGRGVIGSIG